MTAPNSLLELASETVPMRTVFALELALAMDPRRVRLAQALTLNAAKPLMGLRGSHGLFGSDEWWASIREGRMPLLRLSGDIVRVYRAGQDASGADNTIDLKLADGQVQAVGIYLDDPTDVHLFLPGRRAAIVYALDEMKRQPAPDGTVNFSRVALEMAVSVP